MSIHHCRIRKYRKSAHLSQRELALLLGLRSQGAMSDLEAGVKRPGPTIVLGCEVILGVPAHELFPKLYRKAEADALARAQRLKTRLEQGGRRPAAVVGLSALIAKLGDAGSRL